MHAWWYRNVLWASLWPLPPARAGPYAGCASQGVLMLYGAAAAVVDLRVDATPSGVVVCPNTV